MTCRFAPDARQHDPAVALMLIYRIFVTFVSWMVLQARPDTAKEIEILVLHHQLVVLVLMPYADEGEAIRIANDTDESWQDRAVIASEPLLNAAFLDDSANRWLRGRTRKTTYR